LLRDGVECTEPGVEAAGVEEVAVVVAWGPRRPRIERAGEANVEASAALIREGESGKEGLDDAWWRRRRSGRQSL